MPESSDKPSLQISSVLRKLRQMLSENLKLQFAAVISEICGKLIFGASFSLNKNLITKRCPGKICNLIKNNQVQSFLLSRLP
jgi:hypothetical protein